MKKIVSFICLFLFLGQSPTLIAGDLGLNLGERGWPLPSQGEIANTPPGSTSVTKIAKALEYYQEDRPNGRLVFEFPRFFPNLYVMAIPAEFEGADNTNIRFNVDDKIFSAGRKFNSQITINELDLTLYYDIPLVKTLTADTLNIDLGLNVRTIDFDGNIENEQLGKVSKNFIVPIPMVFGALQFHPLNALALEAEGRGMALGANKAFSIVGRIRWNVLDHVFAAGGYRYDKFDIDYQGVLIDADISGPFFEAGLSF